MKFYRTIICTIDEQIPMHPTWQLLTPLSAISFDCDGTLSSIEGINELARYNNVSTEVELLTAKAMTLTGINPDIYQQRLNLVYPTREQVLTLGETYYTNRAPDAIEVIAIFKRLNKTIYLISAGVNPAVAIFGNKLAIADENIHAVDIHFDQLGHYLSFDQSSPLIYNHGKRTLLSQLKELHPNMVHIGDGLNDCLTDDFITRFIGYGGSFYRDHIAAQSRYYIHTPSLAPMLPLCLTQAECAQLTMDEAHLYSKGLAAITNGQVKTSGVKITEDFA